MNRIKLITVILGLSITISLHADKAEGVMEEFIRLEEFLKSQKTSDDTKKKTLEKNLLSALRLSMHRRYLDFENMIKDLSISQVSYEVAKGTFQYYLKYKTYYIFYNFTMDPEIYIQSPVDERFYPKPDGVVLPEKQNHPQDKPKDENKPAPEKK